MGIGKHPCAFAGTSTAGIPAWHIEQRILGTKVSPKMEERIYSWVICAHEDAGWSALREVMRITMNQGIRIIEMMAFMHQLHVDGNTRECGMVCLVFRVWGLKLLMEIPESAGFRVEGFRVQDLKQGLGFKAVDGNTRECGMVGASISSGI